MGAEIGTSKSKSKSGSEFNQNIWSPQGDALQDMYSSASGLFANNNKYANQFEDMANQLSPYMQNIMGTADKGFQNQMGGGSIQGTDNIQKQLMDSIRQTTEGGSQTGKMYNSIVGGEGNSYIDPMIDAMRTGSQENLDRNIGQGELSATSAGQGGSSRHAMSDAMLTRGALQDMNQNEANMRGSAYDTDLNMKLDIANQADKGIQSSQQRLMDMLSQSDSNQKDAMGFGGVMQNLGIGSMAPMMQASQQPWDAFNQYAGALGGPTVLSSGNSNASSKSKSDGASASAKG
jgi:hypothetical protein